MKLIAFIKLTLVGIKRSIFQNILMFSFLPLLLGLGTAYITQDDFNVKNNIPVIKLTIEDKDNSQLSKAVGDYLKSENMKSVLKISEEGDVTIVIPKGYEEALVSLKKTEIRIEEGEDFSRTKLLIVNNILNSFSEGLSETLIMNDKIFKMDMSNEEKQQLMNEVNESFIKYEGKDAISSTIIKNKRSLSAHEFYSLSYLTYIFFIIVMTIAASNTLDETKGLVKRIKTLPLTKMQSLNYNLVGNYILSVVFILLYIFAYRILGLSFKVSIVPLIILILFHGLFLATAASLLELFANKRYTMKIFTSFFVIQFMTSLIPTETMGTNLGKIIQWIKYISPDFLISKTYKDLMIFNNLSSINVNMICIILISLILYLITAAAIHLKRSE